MAREAVAKTNYNSGELAPRVLGRTDVDKYYNGTARMKNFIPLPFGGAQRTPGTMYVDEVRDSDKPARLLDWVFGSREAYLLQLNDSYIQFYKDRAKLNYDTVLLLHGEGIEDTSDSAHVVSLAGGAALTKAQSKFGYGSGVFSGNAQYLNIPDSDDFNLSSGDFTIDFWIRLDSVSKVNRMFYQETSSSTNSWTLRWDNTGTSWVFSITSSGSEVVGIVASDALAINTWYHVALVKSGTTYTIYRDGVSKGSTTDSDNPANYTGLFLIGGVGDTNDLDGYMDEFRLSKGIARWTATFTPPTSAYSEDSYTKLLLHFEAFKDSSSYNHNVTGNGDATESTVQDKFGLRSMLFDGTGDYLSLVDSDDWDLGTGDFTFEAFVRMTDVGTANCLIDYQFNNSNTYGIRILIQSAELTVNIGASTYSFAWSPSINTWYHVAVTRSGTNLKAFVDGAQIGTTQSNSFNFSGSSNVVWVGAHKDGVIVEHSFKGYIDELRVLKGAGIYTANFTAPVAAFTIGAYEIAHEYADDELFDIQTAQAADVMYMAHPEHPPQKLSRFGDFSWTIADVDFQDGPYLDQNDTATTLDPSGTSGSVTVVASSKTGINDGSGFLSTDVGRLIRIKYSSTWYWMKITAVASTVSITATIQESATMSAATATAEWRLGAWSDTTGWPRAVGFFGGGLWWAGTDTQPQTGWRSVILDYENMDEGAEDAADALTVPLNSEKINVIRWLSSGRRLIAGTEGEVFSIWSGTSGTAITPANVKADPETNYGSSGVAPVKIGSYLFYVQDDDATLREFFYDFGIDGHRSVNKSILSDHITQGQIRQMAYQKSPFGIVYAVLEDGKMATFTREIEQEVNGWADQTTRSGDTYESVAAIPVSEGYTEVWFIVSRVINGSTVQHVEYQVNPKQDVEANIEDMVLMQSALTYDGSPATSITGLEHLLSTAVQVLADGVEITGKTVSALGVLTLDSAASVVQVGLGVTAQIKLLPLEGGSQIGSSQGMLKKVSSIFARFYRSLGLTVGEDGGNMEEVFKDGNGAALTSLQTADFELPSTLGWDERQQLLFENDTPFPTTILSTVLYEYTSEENVG